MRIYHTPSKQLGDNWAFANLLLNESIRYDAPIGWHSFCWVDNCRWEDNTKLAGAILAELNSPGRVILTPELGRRALYSDAFASTYAPTKRAWKPNNSKIFCYQFDACYKAEYKNIPDKILEDELLNYLRSCGFTPVRLGKPMSIASIVETLASAEYFVGVESGVSHVAHSVGTPSFLLQNLWPLDRMLGPHGGKSFVRCLDVADFIWRLRVYQQQKKFESLQ